MIAKQSIAGRATVMEDPVNGTWNKENDATRRMILFSRSSITGVLGWR